MKLEAVTLALDSMPWISSVFVELNRLQIDWRWTVVVGVAAPVLDSGHCQKIEPRLPRDGTMKFLNSIRNHPRVTIIQKTLWQGKVAMVNAALEHITEPCVLMQIDSDELWTAEQLAEIYLGLTDRPGTGWVFRCRYFVGPNLYCKDEGMYGNKDYEWVRAWHRVPGQMFLSHCPPRLDGATLERRGHVFDHMAYVYPEQVKFRSKYYKGHEDAFVAWKKLQQCKQFPVPLKDYFHWCKDESKVYQIYGNV